MKNFLISNLVISFIISFNFSFSQELPEIPMKNGMAYYSYEHKLDNTKKCIVDYSGERTFMKKIVDYSIEFTLKRTGKLINNNRLNIVPPGRTAIKNRCLDTLTSPIGFILTKSGELQWRPAIVEALRKRITETEITSQVSMIFISKNTYILVFKDLNCKITYMQGNKLTTEIHSIHELYNEIKMSGKITKADINFFEDLNFFIKSSDEIILKALTETYKADEL